MHFTAWGNKTVAWPCLYMPQHAGYQQRWALFNGTSPIVGNEWTVLFRCRLENFLTEGGRAWVFAANTTNLGGQRAIRLGFGRVDSSQNVKDPIYVKAAFGGRYPAFTKIPAVTSNLWLEVAMTVSNNNIRLSCAPENGMRVFYSWTCPADHASYTTNFIPANIRLGGEAYAGNETAGKTNFRGDLQMFALWGRALSDCEVCEAFGGGAPNLLRIGEENCTAEMFGGAAPASGETVTLDPVASDKRSFPTTLTRGATFRIPFSVDKYAADAAHWVRIKAQNGSASGLVAVALDGNDIDTLAVSSGSNSYLWIPGDKFTLGEHVLTLNRVDGGGGNVKFDVIEVGGAWSAGVVDNVYSDALSDSESKPDTSINFDPDTWNTGSLNLKEFVRTVSRNASGTIHRPRRIVWNLPDNAAGKFGFRMRYMLHWHDAVGETVETCVNGVPVFSDTITKATEKEMREFTIDAENGIFRDGENVITIDYPAVTRTDGSQTYITFDMLSIEPLRPKAPFVMVVR